MDGSIESGRVSDSVTCASKSVGSVVQINSIAIDLSNAMEEIESPANHEHFSIRGFVAGMRKKDPKVCSPFSSEADGGNKAHNLPPLYAPGYRWWQCSNCIPGSSSQRSNLDMVAVGRGDSAATSGQNVVGEQESSSLQDRIGNNHDLVKYGDEEYNYPANAITDSQSLWIEGQEVITCSSDKTDDGNPCADKTEIISDFRKRTDSTAGASDVLPKAGGPFYRFYDRENASSGRDGTASALPHKRKPKLRSLIDIMVEKRNSVTEHPRPSSASSSRIQSTSAETGAVLGLVVPRDVEKGIRRPQTKRKIAPEEEAGPAGMTNPSDSAKKFRGLVLHAGKLCRSIESSGSEWNAYVPLDLEIGIKAQEIKNKKIKASDISKDTRQVHVDKGKAVMIDLPKLFSARKNSQKQAASSESNFGNSGHDPSRLGETGPCFRRFLSGQQKEGTSTMSNSKGSAIEAIRNRPNPPRKSNSEDRNNKGKAALDLSLNSLTNDERNSANQSSFRPKRRIPDLNQAFGYKTAQKRGKKSAVCSENGSFPPQKKLDIPASCSKASIKEGKRPLEVLEQQTVQKTDDNIGQGRTTEEVPMEIVELLAGMSDSIRGSPAPYGDEQSGLVSFPLAKRRNGITISDVNTGVNRSQPNKSQLERDRMEKSQFRLFSSYIPCGKTQYSASNSTMAGPSHTTDADQLWPPRGKNVPVRIGDSQKDNNSIQASSSSLPSIPEQRHKGKTISDIKDLEGKGAANSWLNKEGRIGSSPTSFGSLDPYSNDTIPALQLLSLTNPGIPSGSSSKVGSRSFLDKNFSPYNREPRLNGNQNQNSLDGSFLSRDDHSKAVRSCYIRQVLQQTQVPMEQRTLSGVHLRNTNNAEHRPARSESGSEVCALNRNPAEFSVPTARNEFTISSKDLNPKKRPDSKGKSMASEKGQGTGKDASGKRPSRK